MRKKDVVKSEIQNLLDTFSDGNGYGDPEARRNVELKIQTLLAIEQARIASRLNKITFLLVFVGVLQVAVLMIWNR